MIDKIITFMPYFTRIVLSIAVLFFILGYASVETVVLWTALSVANDKGVFE